MAFPLAVGVGVGIGALCVAGSAVAEKLKLTNGDPNSKDKNYGDRTRDLFNALTPDQSRPEQARYCQTPGHQHR